MSVHGFVAYNPKPEAAYWLECARKVIYAYRQYWPLTARQVFYRLVAEYNYDKTEKAYGRLANILARARRAHPINSTIGIPFEAIRDDRMRYEDAHFFADAAAYHAAVLSEAKRFRIDRQEGQEQIIEMWCEAGGMVPLLVEIADPYTIRVSSGGGYDSVTSKYLLSQRAIERAERGIKTVVLHVGDFDGSGEDMADVLHQDVLTMVAQKVYSAKWRPKDLDDDARVRWALDFFSLERVALTEEQVIDYNVITAPTKPSDSRSRGFIDAHPDLVSHLGTTEISAQLEALTPPDLQALLTDAITSHIDRPAFDATLVKEKAIRDDLIPKVEKLL